MILVWPASMALVVFAVFWATATLPTALVMALATMLAGGVLLTLMFGTAWIIRPRRATPVLRRYR